MKKFFSFICMMAIVLGVNAAPISKKVLDKKQVRTEKKALMKKTPFLKKEKAAKFAIANKKSTVARAKKLDAIDVTCGSWDIQDWGTDGELVLYSEDNTYAFYFDLIYGGDNEDLELGKTYGVSDIYIGADGMYGGVFYDSEWHYGIKALSLVKTMDAEGLVHFVGSVTDSLDASFTFHYDEEPFVLTGDTAYIVCNQSIDAPYYSSTFEDWTLQGANANYAFQLDLLSENSTSYVGNYTSEDFDLDYTYIDVILDAENVEEYQALEAKATITEKGDSIIIDAEIIAENGVVYVISAFYAVPVAQKQETISSTEMIITPGTYYFWNMFEFDASDANNSIYMTLLEDNYIGTWEAGQDITGTVTPKDGEPTNIYGGTIVISEADGVVSLTGTILCYNNVEYTLDLKYTKPAADKKVTLNLVDGKLNILSGAWQAFGWNADDTQFMSLAAYADELAGTYSGTSFVSGYTYVILVEGTDTLRYMTLSDANVTVSVANEVATFSGTLTAQLEGTDELVEFTFNFSLPIEATTTGLDYDEQEADFEEVFASYSVSTQYLAKYGDLIISATNENGAMIGLDIYIAAGESTLTPGTYTISDSEEPMTLYPGSCDGSNVYYSFVGYKDAEGYITKMWFPVEGTVVVSEDGVITIDALNSYGRQIKVTAGQAPEGIENIELTEQAQKVVIDGVMYIIRDNKLFNLQGAQVR